jgi:hypothetical protein
MNGLTNDNDDPFQAEVRVMSYNIRFDNPGDGKYMWSNRKQLVASMIRFHRGT